MKPLTENRKAWFDYEILDTFEAGIVLDGQEVKSVKTGKADLTGSFVLIKPEGALLLNAKMPPYQPVNAPAGYDPTRTRHLLLHKTELDYLTGKSKEGKLTVIPLSLYTKGRRIKVSIGLARHKKKRDKRENIKKREAKREIDRTLKSGS